MTALLANSSKPLTVVELHNYFGSRYSAFMIAETIKLLLESGTFGIIACNKK